ncbi:hypothetical protein BDW67DRAFT_171643, partial [Aspergillus spinulosporus]
MFYHENEANDGKGRGEDGRLLSYKSQIETAIYYSLHYSPTVIKNKTRNPFSLHWVAVSTSNSNND